ncbi:MAG: AraC family transcriptional regulator [Clostridiales bacterium]|nr:AraC family transcriptional regulator [Clostridiales bacterium]
MIFQSAMSQKKLDETVRKQRVQYELESSENGKYHYTYQMELEAQHYWETGKIGELTFDSGKMNTDSYGVMANQYSKQYEYECVCTIALLTRNAIRAGVLEMRSYGLSDIILQQLADAKNIMEMKAIMDKGLSLFQEEIKMVQERRKGSIYIEKTKNYIAKNIFKKIGTREVANELGLNSDYLSRLFKKEEGMTLTHYIQVEKIEAACNMLKYSEQPIAFISEYMNISPQSYFTKIFKKIKGVSPKAYRIKYQKELFN